MTDKTRNYKLAVVGSRDFCNKEYLYAELDHFVIMRGRPEVMISGGCRGVDTLANQWAIDRQIHPIVYKPEKDKTTNQVVHNGYANRNKDIVNACTTLIAFPLKGRSKGTYQTINMARSHLPQRSIHVKTIDPVLVSCKSKETREEAASAKRKLIPDQSTRIEGSKKSRQSYNKKDTRTLSPLKALSETSPKLFSSSNVKAKPIFSFTPVTKPVKSVSSSQ